MKIFLAVLLVAPLNAAAFDDGVDVSAALSAAKAAAAKSTVSAPYHPGEHELDCKDVVVPLSQDEKAATRSVGLESADLKDCGERHGGNRYDAGCRGSDRYTGSRHHASASVTMRSAFVAKPWETVTVQACMDGTIVYLSQPKDKAYRYILMSEGSFENGWSWAYVVSGRNYEKADPAGITARYDLGHNAVFFSDKWADYYRDPYSAETVRISYEIKRKRRGWPDEVVAKGELKEYVTDSYVLRVPGSEPGWYIEYRIHREDDGGMNEKQRVDARHYPVIEPRNL